MEPPVASLRWKADCSPDPTGARLCRQLDRVHRGVGARGVVIPPKVGRVVAAEADGVPFRHAALDALGGISSQHAKARLEGRDPGAVVGRRVVDGHTATCAVEEAIWHLRNALVRAIACTEPEVRRPVVRQVFAEATGRAVGELGDIRIRNAGCKCILRGASSLSGSLSTSVT